MLGYSSRRYGCVWVWIRPDDVNFLEGKIEAANFVVLSPLLSLSLSPLNTHIMYKIPTFGVNI